MDLTESKSNDLLGMAGFGPNVIKLTDKSTQAIVAYIGVVEGKEKIHLPSPISTDQFEAVAELIQKKKFTKHLSNENFQKAQAFADRKFS